MLQKATNPQRKKVKAFSSGIGWSLRVWKCVRLFQNKFSFACCWFFLPLFTEIFVLNYYSSIHSAHTCKTFFTHQIISFFRFQWNGKCENFDCFLNVVCLWLDSSRSFARSRALPQRVSNPFPRTFECIVIIIAINMIWPEQQQKKIQLYMENLLRLACV